METFLRSTRVCDIEYKVIYSRRRTLGISVLPDASVVVRVPFRTSGKTITRIVEEKSSWIIKHRDNFRNHQQKNTLKSFRNGSTHMYKGKDCTLIITEDRKPDVTFEGSFIKMRLDRPDDELAAKRLLSGG